MPQIFKAVVSIAVWVLFIHGLIGILWGVFTMSTTEGEIFAIVSPVSSSIGTVSLFLSLVAVWLRKKLE